MEALRRDVSAGRSEVVERIAAARELARRDRAGGLSELNQLFRSGSVPLPPPNGRFAGELVALGLPPGLAQFAEFLTAVWMPWKGKTFDAARRRGDNVFTRDSLLLARLFWPGYRGYIADGPETYRAFTFRTYVAPGMADPDRGVLKIHYDLPRNPRQSIRRVLDEVVQLAPGIYLGKAHLRWWWGPWQVVAYFTLERGEIERRHDRGEE